MSKAISGLLIFSTGCLTGASIAFAALKTSFEKKLKDELDKAKEDKETVEYDITIYDPLPKEELINAAYKEIENKDSFQNTVASVIKKAMAQKEDDLDIGESDWPIYLISPDEFGENGYEEKQLYYYAADETLCDEDDNVVEPDDTNVGENALDVFVYTDVENCYVRNNETKTDYDIVRIDGSFASYESEGLYE